MVPFEFLSMWHKRIALVVDAKDIFESNYGMENSRGGKRILIITGVIKNSFFELSHLLFRHCK